MQGQRHPNVQISGQNLKAGKHQLLAWANCSKSEANKPVCANIGSKSEGWKVNGRLRWDNCSEKALVCGAQGSRSEGWYAADLELATYKLIEKTKCAK